MQNGLEEEDVSITTREFLLANKEILTCQDKRLSLDSTLGENDKSTASKLQRILVYRYICN